MSGFDRRNDSLGSGQIFEGFHCLLVCDRHIFCASDIMKMRVLRSDSRIVKSGRDRVHRRNLPFLILTEIRLHAMEDSQLTGIDGCRRLIGINASARCLAADQLHIFVFDKMIEGSDRIGAAAHTGNDRVRQPSFLL